MRYLLIVVVILVLTIGACSKLHSAPLPISGWMFASSSDAATYPVLQAHANSSSLAQSNVYTAAGLSTFIKTNQVWQSCASLACLAGCTQIICMYDLESGSSPAPEYADPVGSSASAVSTVHGLTALGPAGTQKILLTYDGGINGITAATCTGSLGAGSLQSISWTNVDYFNLQAQPLVDSSNCTGGANGTIPTTYQTYVTAVANFIRAANPNIKFSTQVSLSRCVPSVCLQGVNAVSNIVDGMYIAYPATCTPANACTAANLKIMLDSIAGIGVAAVGNGQNAGGAVGNGPAGGIAASASPSPSPTPLAHQGIQIYAGCTGDFISEYNPDFSFAGAAKANADVLETTSTVAGHTTHCTAASQTNISQSCPVSQTPLPGEFACIPTIYFSGAKSGSSPGCNNSSFYASNNNNGNTGYNSNDWWHSSSTLTFPNDLSDGPGNATCNSTTSTTTVAAGSLTSVTPGSMTGITVGQWLRVASEAIQVCATPGGTSFTPCTNWASNHGPASYNITTPDHAYIQNSIDMKAFLTTSNSNSPLFNLWANGGAFHDDVFLCGTTNQAVGCIQSLQSIFGNGYSDPTDCSPSFSCVLTAEAAIDDNLNPVPLTLNALGGGGFGYSNLNSEPIGYFTSHAQGNDRQAVEEQCLNASSNGTNQSGGCIAIINTCTQIFANASDRCDFLNNRQPNANGLPGLLRTELAISALTSAALTPYGYAKANWIVNWWDQGGGGTSSSDVDLYNEEDFWFNPFSGMFLPSGQSYMRTYSNNGHYTTASGGGTGDGCTPTTGDSGGMADELINTSSCASTSNGKPAGVYAVEFTWGYYQFTTGGAQLQVCPCAIVWNPRTTTYALAASSLHFTYSSQLQHNGLEMTNAIGGTLTCTNCTGTIQTVPLSTNTSAAPCNSSGGANLCNIPAGDAVILFSGNPIPNPI